MNIFKNHSQRASLSADNEPSMLSEKKKNQGTVKTVEVDPEEEVDCPICKEPVGVFDEGGILEHWRYLPCNHKFGRVCIRTYLEGWAKAPDNNWITSSDKPLCPMCRAPAYHRCGHVVLPQPAGARPRPTTDSCGFCEIDWRKARYRSRRHKPRVLWRRALVKLLPSNTPAYWRARDAWIRAQLQHQGSSMWMPWQEWWEHQDQQPLRIHK